MIRHAVCLESDSWAMLTDGTDYQLVRAVVEATEAHKRIFAFES